MDISHFEFSLVVVANDHNPTMLNPDFLERQGIVQEGWGWKVVGPAITRPPFATVSFDSQVTVSVEANRLQVTDTPAVGAPQSSKVVDIAQKYVEVLPGISSQRNPCDLKPCRGLDVESGSTTILAVRIPIA